MADTPSENESSDDNLRESGGEKKLTVEEMSALVKQRYLDRREAGGFSGVNTLQREIFLETGVFVPQHIVTSVLLGIPVYVNHVRPIRRFPRGTYGSVHNYG